MTVHLLLPFPITADNSPPATADNLVYYCWATPSPSFVQPHRKHTMFAASLTSSSRPPWPSITLSLSSSTTVKSCLSVAKFRRKSRSQNHDKDYMQSGSSLKEGVVGQAVLTAFKSIPEQHPGAGAGARVVKSQIEEEQTKTVERQLRGSDVLRAIQRASVEKANQSLKQKNNKRDISPPRMRMTSIKGEQMPLKNDYCTTTTTTDEPLHIKSEWGVRLEELEKRLYKIMLLE